MKNKKEYLHKYYIENKEKLDMVNKEYAKNHKKETREYQKQYRIDHKDELDKYRIDNKDKIIERSRRNFKIRYAKDKVKLNKRRHEIRAEILASWSGIIPFESLCQICGKKVYFNNKDQKNAVHFDHRRNNSESIKCSPVNWLRTKRYTIENKKIWDSCDFGILCLKCNINLPTIGRIEWLKKALEYTQT